MKRLLGVLALALSLACGSSSGSSPGPSQTNCDKSNQDAGPSNPADLQSTLTFQGRHDSGLDTFFGSASADIFVQADQLMAGAGQDAAAQLMVTPGDPDLSAASCGNALRSGLDAGSIHTIYRDMPLNLAMAVLANLIDEIPLPSAPMVVDGHKENSAGDPSIKADIEVTVQGIATSKITVEARSTLTLVSSTLGTVQETQSIHIDLDVCPDPSAKAKGQVSLTLHGSSSPAGGGAALSYDLSVHNDLAFLVNDNAEIASVKISGGAAYQSTGAQNSNIAVQADQTTDEHLHGASNPNLTIVTNDGSPEAQTLVGKNLLKPGDYVAVVSAPQARKKWQGGTCVEIKVDPATTSVRTGQKLQLTASVRQKFDMTDLTVPVVATFDGSGSLTPGDENPVQAPAKYEYDAGTPGDMDTVTFTSTSIRGIGKKTVTLTVCPDCAWKGTITIDASGSTDTDMSTDPNFTFTTHYEATYSASYSVVVDGQDNMTLASGSATGTLSYNTKKHAFENGSFCAITEDETVNGSATGDAKATAGAMVGSLSAYEGQYSLGLATPALQLMGTSDDQLTTTETNQPGYTGDCPGSTMDKMGDLSYSFQLTINPRGTYDDNNPVISDSSTTDGSLGGIPVKVHATWSLQ